MTTILTLAAIGMELHWGLLGVSTESDRWLDLAAKSLTRDLVLPFAWARSPESLPSRDRSKRNRGVTDLAEPVRNARPVNR